MCLVTDSTNIAAVGYSRPHKILRVRFRDGSEYQLSKVGAAAFNGLLEATSIGSHYAKHFRGRFPTWRVRRPRPRAHAS